MISILANEDLSPQTTPILTLISSRLERLTESQSAYVRRAAKEARLVLTIRSHGASTSSKAKGQERKPDQEVYQEALKLIQDPILPVRAHGLSMLKALVAPKRSSSTPTPAPVDPALIPAILDIFLQSIQDDDSFVFLNAVQGLAAMVDQEGLGKRVLGRLVAVYSSPSSASFVATKSSGSLKGKSGAAADLGGMGKGDLDKRLRVGEALLQVVKRCGEALPAYGK